MSTTLEATTLELGDIQGNVLRGYRMHNARHFVLGIGHAAGAANFIGLLVSGDETAAPQITTADHWGDRPRYCLNIGFTFAGLQALGLPAGLLQNFPAAFRRGPVPNAEALGDTGISAPTEWYFGGPGTPAVHMVVSLFTDEHRRPDSTTPEDREHFSAILRSLFEANGLVELYAQDANAFRHGAVHFGYKDGIAQPRIRGVPAREWPDMQPECEPGEFLLGKDYVNQYHGNFIGDLPRELCDNGTYSGFRMLKQDVFGFEDFLNLAAQRYNVDAEYVAAKLMGRWRNGVPLVMSPESPVPAHKIDAEHLNKFDYRPTAEHPVYFDDSEGMRCPVGAHIRRMNPRGALATGKPHSRRIIRRGIPYGPDVDFNNPDLQTDDIERGLIGHFFCGDIEMQFEFLYTVWVNQDLQTAGIKGTREPLLGAQPDFGGQFILRTNDERDPIVFDNMPRFIATRGSAYCFMPGIGGLRFLSGL